MSIQNSGISSNLFQTMALIELAQATSQLNTQQGTGAAGGASTDCATSNQGSEAQAVLSALEGNLPIGQTQQNYNSNEMDQLLAMESLLAQEQAQASTIGNNYNSANCDNGYGNGYGSNNGYNSYAEPAYNAIENELQIGNEALLLAMLQQDSQNGTSTSNTTAQPSYSQNRSTNPSMTRSGHCDSNNGMNANYTSNNSSSNYLNNSTQEASYWSAGATTVPWLSESGATPVSSSNPGGINRVY